MTEAQTTPETARDRARRMIIAPCEAQGMRFRKGTDEADARKRIAAILDAVSYLGEPAMRALAEWLMTHGEGTQRCFWPTLQSIASIAEHLEPRPLEDMPGVTSWFRSVAGPAARAENRLVAELIWWQRKKRPPVSPHERRLVTEKARELSDRAMRIDDKIARGMTPLADDAEWLRWYRGLEARAEALVKDGEAKRAAEGEAA